MKYADSFMFQTTDPEVEGKRARDALQKCKVLHMTPSAPLGDLRTFYDKFVESVGEPVTIGEDYTKGGVATGERWLEIRYDEAVPDTAAFRHSQNAQPLHTDESYVSNPADVMLFYCVEKAPSGGETVFLDGTQVVELLGSKDPELLRQLATTTVRYSKADEYRDSVILSIDETDLPRLNFNYFCIDPDCDPLGQQLNDAFHQFLEGDAGVRKMRCQILLQPGEAVAWWDETVLHGRDSFVGDPAQERFLWKTGIKMERSLERQ